LIEQVYSQRYEETEQQRRCARCEAHLIAGMRDIPINERSVMIYDWLHVVESLVQKA
jgi:hypothetical protein